MIKVRSHSNVAAIKRHQKWTILSILLVFGLYSSVVLTFLSMGTPVLEPSEALDVICDIDLPKRRNWLAVHGKTKTRGGISL